MMTNRLRATTGYELQPKCFFLCTIKGTLNGLLKQATREDLNELLSTDAGREHFLNRLEIKEMNEIDVVEAVQDASLDD